MRLLGLTVISLFIFSCKNEAGKSTADLKKVATDTANFTTVQWIDSVQDIGILNFGEKVDIKFHFRNTGDKPLFIISATPGCGCTVADYPKEPISPGKEGTIVASFDTNKGNPGTFNKGITVTTNTKPNGNSMLSFTGTIKEKKPEAKEAAKSE